MKEEEMLEEEKVFKRESKDDVKLGPPCDDVLGMLARLACLVVAGERLEAKNRDRTS